MPQIANAVVSTTRDGVPGTVLSGVPVNKSRDRLEFTPAGPMLLATVIADPPAAPDAPTWLPGDYMTLTGATNQAATQSAYKVLAVDDRSGDLIPCLRILVQGQMVVP